VAKQFFQQGFPATRVNLVIDIIDAVTIAFAKYSQILYGLFVGA
jgi:hypothetical protein